MVHVFNTGQTTIKLKKKVIYIILIKLFFWASLSFSLAKVHP